MFKSGFISIIGRPNVGKSTLMNAIMGEKIAITTPKPQTTRNRIMGIRNVEQGQLIFLDTPGIHRPETLLNRTMVKTALDTLGDSDVLLFVIEATTTILQGDDQLIIDSLRDSLKEEEKPVLLVINKIDLVDKSKLLPLMDHLRNLYPFAALIPISALNGNGVPLLLKEIWELLPEGPEYFPEDMLTDRSERFIAAEMIREQIILLTRQEIPYILAVVVDSFKESPNGSLLRIQATISVEKDSQKGILIGRRGSMLKQIGTAARFSLEKFFATKVYLELFVKVRKDWTTNEKILKEFGYGDKT